MKVKPSLNSANKSLYNQKPANLERFPEFQYSSGNSKILNQYEFHFSDLSDGDYSELCNIPNIYKSSVATQWKDVGKITRNNCPKFKPNASPSSKPSTKVFA